MTKNDATGRKYFSKTIGVKRKRSQIECAATSCGPDLKRVRHESDEDAAALADALQINASLTEIDVSETQQQIDKSSECDPAVDNTLDESG
jgi:hypothetical protein